MYATAKTTCRGAEHVARSLEKHATASALHLANCYWACYLVARAFCVLFGTSASSTTTSKLSKVDTLLSVEVAMQYLELRTFGV